MQIEAMNHLAMDRFDPGQPGRRQFVSLVLYRYHREPQITTENHRESQGTTENRCSARGCFQCLLIQEFIHSRIYKAPLQETYSEAPLSEYGLVLCMHNYYVYIVRISFH